jgi:hypothetical protein
LVELGNTSVFTTGQVMLGALINDPANSDLQLAVLPAAQAVNAPDYAGVRCAFILLMLHSRSAIAFLAFVPLEALPFV